MRIAITGATGLLGRNLLFEILKNNLSQLNNIEIFILGRSHKNLSLAQRINNILLFDGTPYLNIPNNGSSIDEIMRCLKFIEFDLTEKDLAISGDDIRMLSSNKIDAIFHLAALSDFRDTAKLKNDLGKVNYFGTINLLNLANAIGIKEFIYSSSAYCAGYIEGRVLPDYINSQHQFRNPYEESKLKAEMWIRNNAPSNKINYKIFRLTGIGGRLIEAPIGSICKYDIFYGWGQFFLKQKLKKINDMGSIYEHPFEMKIRIRINKSGGMNVVPADYAAKIIYAASVMEHGNKSYHLVNDKDIPNMDIGIILQSLNIGGWQMVECDPGNKNDLERLYYRSVGKIFTPYVITGPIKYDNSNLEGLQKKTGLKCPPMTTGNFVKLLNYAKSDYFGLFPNKERSQL